MKILNYEKLENQNVILKLSLTLDEFDESYAFCNDCGNVVDIDSAVEYDGSFYCNDCVEECSCCHQLIPNSALKEVDDSSYLYCPHCWNEETYICHACGTHFRYDDMELHCSQTTVAPIGRIAEFEYPMELHCSQTYVLSIGRNKSFEYPMELHCSQTAVIKQLIMPWFEYPMELHCSQTIPFLII